MTNIFLKLTITITSILIIQNSAFSKTNFEILNNNEINYNKKSNFTINITNNNQPSSLSYLNFKIKYNNEIIKINKNKNDLFLFKNYNSDGIFNINLKNKKIFSLEPCKNYALNIEFKVYKNVNFDKINLFTEIEYIDHENNKQKINLENTFSIKKPNNYLKNLVPSNGILVPNFSKNIFNYNLYKIDENIDFIKFNAIGETGEEKIKINGERLKKNVPTEIKITVMDKETKIKNNYYIKINKNFKKTHKNKKDKKIIESNQENYSYNHEQIKQKQILKLPMNLKKIKKESQNNFATLFLKNSIFFIGFILIIYLFLIRFFKICVEIS